VGDVVALVRIERDHDAIDALTTGVDQRGQSQHVGMGTADRQRGRRGGLAQRVQGAPALGQVTEVVLRVDDQQGGAAAHGVLLGRW